MTSPADTVRAVRQLAAQVGYVACGVADAELFEEYVRAVEARCRSFPDAAHLYQQLLRRADPRATTPWACSIIVCIRHYGKYRLPSPYPTGIGRNYLFDRRHRGNPDWHMPKAMRQGLEDLGMRVKPGGVPERWAAVRAGVGRFGRNCFVYVDGYGSWVNIESFRVDADLPPDTPTPELACPPNCRACIDACPTAALRAPNSMSYDRCIAHLTYGAAHPIEPSLWNRMGPWIYGCDRCQEVCPMNAGTWTEREDTPWLTPLLPLLSPQALATMDDETYRTRVQPAFWYIGPDDVERWRRNAKRAMGNLE